MNKRLLKYLFGFILVTCLAGIACEGPTGSTGPEGPRGPQGEQGPQGEDGNANIMYSDWMDIMWDVSIGGTPFMYISEPRITSEFLDEGSLVLMYLRGESSNGVIWVKQLPMLLSGNYFISFTAAYYPEGTSPLKSEGLHLISLSAQALDGTPTPGDILDDYQVRYFLVPGSMNLAAKGVDWQDYEQVMEYYGIPE